LASIREEFGAGRYDGGHFPEAVDLFMKMVQKEEFDEFLSVPAYELLD
jgi:malate synthase